MAEVVRPAPVPAERSLDALRAAVGVCRACPLYEPASQPVRHGQPVRSELAPIVGATWHPSAILRAPDEQAREASMNELVADLAGVAQAMTGRGEGSAASPPPSSGRLF